MSLIYENITLKKYIMKILMSTHTNEEKLNYDVILIGEININ